MVIVRTFAGKLHAYKERVRRDESLVNTVWMSCHSLSSSSRLSRKDLSFSIRKFAVVIGVGWSERAERGCELEMNGGSASDKRDERKLRVEG